MRHLPLALLLTSCTTYTESLLPDVCLWLMVGRVDAPLADRAEYDCYRVTAPEHARVSPVQVDACDAEALGLVSVTVRRGESVWRYSEPNLAGAGEFKTQWVRCGGE